MQASNVTDPVAALLAACRAAGVERLGLLSPYVEPVSARLRDVLAKHGIETPVFATFQEAEEAKVAAIDEASIRSAALKLMADGGAQALFLSCTNLRTLNVILELQEFLNIPVWSSNLVLAWDMQRLAGRSVCPQFPGGLLQS